MGLIPVLKRGSTSGVNTCSKEGGSKRGSDPSSKEGEQEGHLVPVPKEVDLITVRKMGSDPCSKEWGQEEV